MGIAWSTWKSKREVKAKAKRYKVTSSLDLISESVNFTKVSTTFSFLSSQVTE